MIEFFLEKPEITCMLCVIDQVGMQKDAVEK